MNALTTLRSSRELLWNLTLRELRTKYRRSFLGWAWSMLNPLATVAIYSFVFGSLLGSDAPLGDPSGLHVFALYLLCALLPWNFFALVTNSGMGSLLGNAGLVRKVAFPRQVLILSQVLHGCVQFGIEIGLLVVVLVIAGSPVLPWLPVTVGLMLLLAVFATGFALALSALAVYFRDLGYLWQILLQVWFFATPIVYPESLLDDRSIDGAARRLLDINPMSVFARAFRRTLYDGTAPGLRSVGYLVLAALISLIVGWWAFSKLSRRVAEEL